jgi:hypothetical protein
MLLADVIFPAFASAYFSILFFPIAGVCAVATEVLVFRWYNRGMSLRRIVAFVVYANLVSWFAGAIIGCVLPSGLTTMSVNAGEANPAEIFTTGPWWTVFALASFVVACILSIGIEYAALAPFWHRLFPARTLGKCVILGNVLGYIVLFVLVLIHLQFFA